MNKIKNILFVLLMCSVVLFPGCGGDPPDDPQPPGTAATEEQTRVQGLMKSSTWKLQTLTVDNVAQPSAFPNMTLTFTDAGFTASGGKDVWPNNGTWSFDKGVATSFVRNDGIAVTIEAITSTDMTLSLNWTTTKFGPGRMQGIKGKNVFKFGK